MTLTLTDLFCGAGGSSTGAIAVPGVEVKYALNHWALAIETHNTNHPTVSHDCADISQVDPRRYARTDILWASPECTNHSQARGKKRETATRDLFDETLPDEAAERSRATMWDVPRFAEFHRYKAIIIENVVDALHWLPFPAWLMSMDSLGYEHEIVFLNSMHAQALGAPAPQSRDRMYVIFWRKGNQRPPLEKYTRPLAVCPTCGPIKAVQSWKRPDRPKWGRHKAQYVFRCPNVICRNTIVEPGWLPAAAAIDWSIQGQRIGDRVKPLAPKTMARIQAGIQKYWREPFTAEVAGNTFERRPGVRTWSTDDVLRTLHTTASKALLVPAGGTWRDTATTTDDVMPTRTTVETDGLLIPVEGRDGKRTMTTRNDPPVLTPFIATMRGQSKTHSTEQPLTTVSAGGGHHGVVIPLRANNTVKGTEEAFDTFAANGNHHALLMRNNGSRGAGGEMSTPIDETMRTLTTTSAQSLLLPYQSKSTARPASEPFPTLTTIDPAAVVSALSDVEIEDCLFRMLEPSEIARGMAFPTDYVILGNKREQVKQAGNAVTPPAARDLIAAVAESLIGAAA